MNVGRLIKLVSISGLTSLKGLYCVFFREASYFVMDRVEGILQPIFGARDAVNIKILIYFKNDFVSNSLISQSFLYL